MTVVENGFQTLRHRFVIEAVTKARMEMLNARRRPDDYGDEDLPPHVRAAVTTLSETGEVIHLRGPHDTYWLPKPVPRPNWFSMARGYGQRMKGKYSLAGFVAVAPGDVVVDCGAYAGAYAISASEQAEKVIAVEPAPVSLDCLRKNVAASGSENIVIEAAGLLDRDDTLTLHLRENSTDNSFLDDETTAETLTVPVMTIRSLLDKHGLDRIDLLKTEAEGLELEILSTATPDVVAKIAVDCSPERDGQSPLLDIAVMLAQKGYRLANRNYLLFASAVA